MNGPEAYKRAVGIARAMDHLRQGGTVKVDELALGQLYATLALTAATAEARGLHWDEVLT
jgi:hypothetical protein